MRSCNWLTGHHVTTHLSVYALHSLIILYILFLINYNISNNQILFNNFSNLVLLIVINDNDDDYTVNRLHVIFIYEKIK